MSNEMRFTGSNTYIASEELMAAVDVARILEKPLLIDRKSTRLNSSHRT